MLFTSWKFLYIFLPLVLIGSIIIRRYAPRGSVWFLVILSLVFYSAHNGRLVPLICASIIFNFYIGNWVYRTTSSSMLALGIATNLAVLGYFKYYTWTAETLSYNGLSWFPIYQIALPLAISFFSFEQISYLVDCKKQRISPATFEDYSFFVAFFPKLIAGPIVRYSEIQPQFCALRERITAEAFTAGSALFIIGLGKKVIFADQAALFADPAFAATASTTISQIDAAIGVLAYTFQIYFDFSGYSDMAIGLALIFGLRLPLNFSSPYKATSIIEFWRRWHMTLSRFLRDYLYVPLGGNRHGSTRRTINLMIVMLLGGLWHGAGFTFIIWGALHGLYLIINHQIRILTNEKYVDRYWYRAAGWLITMIAVMTAWVFFRSGTVGASMTMFQSLIGLADDTISPLASLRLQGLLTVGALLAICLMPNSNDIMGYRWPSPPEKDSAVRWYSWRPTAYCGAILGLFLAITATFRVTSTPFIYFQF